MKNRKSLKNLVEDAKKIASYATLISALKEIRKEASIGYENPAKLLGRIESIANDALDYDKRIKATKL